MNFGELLIQNYHFKQISMKSDYFNNPAKYLEDRGIVYKYENKIYKSNTN